MSNYVVLHNNNTLQARRDKHDKQQQQKSTISDYWKVVSAVKAPARRKSSFIITQNMRCGHSLDHGAGRLTYVRKMYSLASGEGKPLDDLDDEEVTE